MTYTIPCYDSLQYPTHLDQWWFISWKMVHIFHCIKKGNRMLGIYLPSNMAATMSNHIRFLTFLCGCSFNILTLKGVSWSNFRRMSKMLFLKLIVRISWRYPLIFFDEVIASQEFSTSRYVPFLHEVKKNTCQERHCKILATSIWWTYHCDAHS